LPKPSGFGGGTSPAAVGLSSTTVSLAQDNHITARHTPKIRQIFFMASFFPFVYRTGINSM
jgi:hypothetical protein